MQRIFTIVKQQFLNDMIELFFKDKGVSTYQLESLEQSDYHLTDMRPLFVIYDLEIYDAKLDKELQIPFKLLKKLNIPLIFLWDEKNKESLDQFSQYKYLKLKKPLSLTSLDQASKALLTDILHE